MFLNRSVQDSVMLLKWDELEQQVTGTVRKEVMGPSVRRGDVTEIG
ncbi:hypothetical protein A2U01_0100397, partial [Trifolium medium]|nr:hypothetical protein [Trifolium medium]